jgi:hypothetical protein
MGEWAGENAHTKAIVTPKMVEEEDELHGRQYTP